MNWRGPTTRSLGDNNDHHGYENHWTESWDDPPSKGKSLQVEIRYLCCLFFPLKPWVPTWTITGKNMGVSKNRGKTPQNGWFLSWKTLLKFMIWGGPPLFFFGNTHIRGKGKDPTWMIPGKYTIYICGSYRLTVSFSFYHHNSHIACYLVDT